MTGETDETQDFIINITKKERGFLRPAARELGLGLDWV